MAIISITLLGITSILLGIIILIWPSVIRWAIGLYLIFFGITQLLSQYL